jgi:two-component system alkaline phosphatase synthesis response regulator PhoP
MPGADMIKTILVVDDDSSIVHLLKEDLEIEGYRVIEAYEGQTALQLAKKIKPHLIVMDVNMPLLNGLKALEYLRLAEETSKIPVLFLTGEATSNVAPTLGIAPRVAHVKKPIDLEDLNSLVRQMIEKYPVEESEA